LNWRWSAPDGGVLVWSLAEEFDKVGAGTFDRFGGLGLGLGPGLWLGLGHRGADPIGCGIGTSGLVTAATKRTGLARESAPEFGTSEDFRIVHDHIFH
jgi:hypothetical protein